MVARPGPDPRWNLARYGARYAAGNEVRRPRLADGDGSRAASTARRCRLAGALPPATSAFAAVSARAAGPQTRETTALCSTARRSGVDRRPAAADRRAEKRAAGSSTYITADPGRSSRHGAARIRHRRRHRADALACARSARHPMRVWRRTVAAAAVRSFAGGDHRPQWQLGSQVALRERDHRRILATARSHAERGARLAEHVTEYGLVHPRSRPDRTRSTSLDGLHRPERARLARRTRIGLDSHRHLGVGCVVERVSAGADYAARAVGCRPSSRQTARAGSSRTGCRR